MADSTASTGSQTPQTTSESDEEQKNREIVENMVAKRMADIVRAEQDRRAYEWLQKPEHDYRVLDIEYELYCYFPGDPSLRSTLKRAERHLKDVDKILPGLDRYLEAHGPIKMPGVEKYLPKNLGK